MDSKTRALLAEHPSLEVIQDGAKVKCKLTGHEMPCRPDALTTYINGKKYKRLKEKQVADIEKYKEHLVPSNKKGRKNQLFCKLTWRHCNNLPHHIQRHVQGKRFQKALARWEECQRLGTEFKPREGQQKVKTTDSDEEKSDRDDSDDLNDLYPDEYFMSEEEEEKNENDVDAKDEESDFDFEDMKVDEEPPMKQRKQDQGQTVTKKKKKKSGKTKT